MEFIKLTEENLEKEHICCAVSYNKDCQVVSKKEWLSERMKEGLVFLKGDVRGKCFIEYLPAEYAWAPVQAPDYLYIDCLWVAGQYQGQGNAGRLLEAGIRDGKEKKKKGLAVLSSGKKIPYLSDKKFLMHKGFRLADKAEPYFELMYLPFEENAPVPSFKPQAKKPQTDEKGFTLYYTKQCPFTAKYVPLITQYAKEQGLSFRSVHIASREAAQNASSPFTTYTLFYNGKFVTHEILSPKKFEGLVEKLTGNVNGAYDEKEQLNEKGNP